MRAGGRSRGRTRAWPAAATFPTALAQALSLLLPGIKSRIRSLHTHARLGLYFRRAPDRGTRSDEYPFVDVFLLRSPILQNFQLQTLLLCVIPSEFLLLHKPRGASAGNQLFPGPVSLSGTWKEFQLPPPHPSFPLSWGRAPAKLMHENCLRREQACQISVCD